MIAGMIEDGLSELFNELEDSIQEDSYSTADAIINGHHDKENIKKWIDEIYEDIELKDKIELEIEKDCIFDDIEEYDKVHFLGKVGIVVDCNEFVWNRPISVMVGEIEYKFTREGQFWNSGLKVIERIEKGS